MTKPLALAFGTRDRVELSDQSFWPLLADGVDIMIVDGSKTYEGAKWVDDRCNRDGVGVRRNIKGGADSWICYALSMLLDETEAPFLGLCENDVLLPHGWLGPTLGLFNRGRAEGLEVGAVSARCYEDRILCQRDGYALCHNLGAGHLILTRHAARIALDHVRTSWTTENVRTFARLSGLDIRRHWAFRGGQNMITLDWGIERVLAEHGLASLALMPSDVEMIGQDPPLEQQGLTIARQPVELLRNDTAFQRFAKTTERIRHGDLVIPNGKPCRLDDGSQLIFPHQLGHVGGYRSGEWRLKWCQGFGPFAFEVVEPEAIVEVPLSGPVEFFVSGGEKGGQVRIVDRHSGYELAPKLDPEGPSGQVLQLHVPGTVHHRIVHLTAITPGVKFYGIKVHEPQPVCPHWSFDHSQLPKPGV